MADLEQQTGISSTPEKSAETNFINQEKEKAMAEAEIKNLIIGSSNLTIVEGGTYQIVDPQPASGTNQIIVIDGEVLTGSVNFILPNSSVYDDGFSRNYYFILKGSPEYSVAISTAKVEKPNVPDYINGKTDIGIEPNCGLNIQKYTTGRYRATLC